MANPSADNFDFKLIGTDNAPFVGYISADDPTRVSPQALVRGSQNVILENTGNINNRVGRKLYDPADNTDDPVVTSFDWVDTDGNLLLVRVLQSGKLQFYNHADTTWYTIYTYTDNKTDVCFAKWWDLENSRELLLMCNGTPNLYAWAGGVVQDVGEVVTDNTILVEKENVTFTITTDTNLGNALEFTSVSDRLAMVFTEDVVGDGFLLMTLSRTLPTPLSATGIIQIVDVLVPAPDATTAVVVKGLSPENTAQNILNLFQNPADNTTSQNGFTDANLIDLLDDMTYSMVPSLENDVTWASLGFINDGVLIVNNVEYPYGLIVGDYLTNIQGVPPEGDVGYSGLVVTPNRALGGNYPSMLDYNNDFLLVLNNQLIVSSHTSRIVHISFNEDYTDFDQTGDLIFGDPDFVILDEFPRGGVIRGDSAYIGAGNSSWYEISPNTPVEYNASQARTVYAKVTKFSGAGLTAPLGFNFVTTWGEDIIYVDQQNQLRTLGIYRNVFEQKSPSLSLAVRAELQEEDFTGGAIRAVGEYVYMIAPISGKTYLYQIRDDVDSVGNITSQRLWQPPQTWGISRVAIINGIPHGYSAETPQLYQLFQTNQWHDDTSEAGVYAPYISVARFAYRQAPQRNKLIGFDKIYYEGYILPDSDLTANIYYDYRGATYLEEKLLSDNGYTPILFGGEGVTLIGGKIIGNTTIGGGRRDEDYSNPLPKFRAITNVLIKDVFEYQLELVSENLDSRWQMIALGANEREVTNKSVNLQLPT